MNPQNQKVFNAFSRASACSKMQKIYPELSDKNVRLGYLSICEGKHFFLNVLCFYTVVAKEDLPYNKCGSLPAKTEKALIFIRVEWVKDGWANSCSIIPLECVTKEKACQLGATIIITGTPYHYRSINGDRALRSWV